MLHHFLQSSVLPGLLWPNVILHPRRTTQNLDLIVHCQTPLKKLSTLTCYGFLCLSGFLVVLYPRIHTNHVRPPGSLMSRDHTPLMHFSAPAERLPARSWWPKRLAAAPRATPAPQQDVPEVRQRSIWWWRRHPWAKLPPSPRQAAWGGGGRGRLDPGQLPGWVSPSMCSNLSDRQPTFWGGVMLMWMCNG